MSETQATENKKGKIALDEGSFVGGDTPVEVPQANGPLTLYVKELSYAEEQLILGKARQTGSGNPFSELVAAAVHDGNGNFFTVDEINRLRDEVAQPLFAALIRNSKVNAEKN